VRPGQDGAEGSGDLTKTRIEEGVVSPEGGASAGSWGSTKTAVAAGGRSAGFRYERENEETRGKGQAALSSGAPPTSAFPRNKPRIIVAVVEFHPIIVGLPSKRSSWPQYA
jgi:hypothetical protein